MHSFAAGEEGMLFLSIDLEKELSRQVYSPNLDTYRGGNGQGKKSCNETQVKISRFHLTLKSQGHAIKGQIKDK